MDGIGSSSPPTYDSPESPYIPHAPYANNWFGSASIISRNDSDTCGESIQTSLLATGSFSDYVASPSSYSGNEPVTSIHDFVPGNSAASNGFSLSGILDTDSLPTVTDPNLSEREIATTQPRPRSKQERKLKFKCFKCSGSTFYLIIKICLDRRTIRPVFLTKNKKQHMSVHSSNRIRFYCCYPSCGVGYFRKHDLHRHAKKDHAGHSIAESDSTRYHHHFRCDACRKNGFGDGQGRCECGYDVISTF